MILNEDFSNVLDGINDSLTDICETPVEGIEQFLKNVEVADTLLRAQGLLIDYDDIESIRGDMENPSEDEAITFLIPLYNPNQEQTEYNLHIIYFQGDDDSIFEMDMEVQYNWEVEDSDEMEDVDFD